MGFLSSVAHTITDPMMNGMDAWQMRDELNQLRGEITKDIKVYKSISQILTSWENPLNSCGKYTSAMLHQTSDYVHGLAFNYSKVVTDTSVNLLKIKRLSDANLVNPILNIPIPGHFGKLPSALIPGVEALKMVEGLLNIFLGSMALLPQLHQARHNSDQLRNEISRAQNNELILKQICAYFLHTSTNLLKIFHRTTGLTFPTLAANTPDQLQAAVNDMESIIEQITNIKGNAFTISRFIMNLVKEKSIKKASPAQIDWIAEKLFSTVPGIQQSFKSEENVKIFVNNFFAANLLTPAILLHLPQPPSTISEYIKETPPAHHQTYSDPNSSKYDPPSISLGDFPS
ncbi:hypothetical protein [Phaeodactylibacter xiamenensis]|jgi:hypothetical protein|uniref:hypothetical protein n=1 Tax=Phaeodactylibacter xiamenensis TaxID=1524460 RepID=UPI0024A80E9D|nr:hypothetical protein [Phaeodactylibacter xiamenensis]